MTTAPTPDPPLVPGPPGRLLARLYTAVVERRNQRFDSGRGVVTLDRPVISVGNLSLGGTGKTPMVARIIDLLRGAGHDPCVAMRGYASKRNADRRSDEAEIYRAAFEDLPIVAQPDRVDGLIALFGSERGEHVDCIVLDDGFQHRRIARQVDLVLVDASRDLLAGGVFPAGRLREPARNLGRATHVTLTHAESVADARLDSIRENVGRLAPRASVSVACHEWSSLGVLEFGAAGEVSPGSVARRVVASEAPVSWLRGKRVVAACAIGRPGPFLGAIERAGALAAESFVLPDHHAFGAATVRRISRAAVARDAEAIVLTEKDWTKLADRPVPWPCPVVRPRLELAFRSGWDTLAADLLAAAASSPE
ncbi:MAG TPA: tetraacyldisaccharide 4'-kinase [Phycisphaerales bacterium]|nr:tetraacyldisaccharide 4'-kinase [Phycisphaerales bacterium]